MPRDRIESCDILPELAGGARGHIKQHVPHAQLYSTALEYQQLAHLQSCHDPVEERLTNQVRSSKGPREQLLMRPHFPVKKGNAQSIRQVGTRIPGHSFQ